MIDSTYGLVGGSERPARRLGIFEGGAIQSGERDAIAIARVDGLVSILRRVTVAS